MAELPRRSNAVVHLASTRRGYVMCGRKLYGVDHVISWSAFVARSGRPLPDGGQLCRQCKAAHDG